MPYCVNSTIVTNVIKGSKIGLLINIKYGVMYVEEKTVRNKQTGKFVLTVIKK